MSNGTLGRVYGGDPNMIHYKDGTRKDAGLEIAAFLETQVRHLNALRGTEGWQDKELCPGCYMVSLYNAAVHLAKLNGQSLKELGESMADIFSRLAENPPADYDEALTEEIFVFSDGECLTKLAA